MAENWENDFRNQVEDVVKKKTVEIATKVRDKLTDYYSQYVILKFYTEYDEQKYNRHYGLFKSYKKYYRNSHGSLGGIVHGGVEITSAQMPHVYHDPTSEVFRTYLLGYHGRESLGINFGLDPVGLVQKYRDQLANPRALLSL